MADKKYRTSTGAEFAPERIREKGNRRIFKPFVVTSTSSLKDALDQGRIKNNAELIIVAIDSEHPLAFPKYQMAYHHIAMGTINKTPYLLTFCTICNSGTLLNPVVEGETLKFYIDGVYNGMMIMRDKKTRSYWDHITGECLSGAYRGTVLKSMGSHQYAAVSQALEVYPDIEIALPQQNFAQQLVTCLQAAAAGMISDFLPPGFRRSMADIDPRLPDMDMGLGVWDDNIAKYYSLTEIRDRHAIIDRFANKNLVVYFDPVAKTPGAMFADASSFEIEDDAIRLDGHRTIRNGQLYDGSDRKIHAERPSYIFSRWYGFSLTFPNCDVFGQA